MRDEPSATWLLEQETRALLTRLAAVQPFVLQETHVAAAALSPAALAAIEDYLITGRREVHRRARAFLRWLRGPGATAPAAEQQRRFWMLRLSFQSALSQFDLFSEVITQRSEHDNGVLLSGLDVAAAEALLVPGDFYEGPPVICSLHRGLGGSIRRVQTRLPGGGETPVALIRIPRERMIGYGIASSLVHEVGHQGAALLRLVDSLRAPLREIRRHARPRPAWDMWDRWISEIVADYWAISRIGIGSTLGLIGLVSLPRGFVFRPSDDDPHPMPWVRVLLSCAIGDRLYPDPQWERLAATWRAMYPLAGLRPGLTAVIADLRATMPEFVSLLVEHRPPRLRGWALGEVLRNPELQRESLLNRFASWEAEPSRMELTPPTVAFAVLGQARASGRLSPERESRLLRRLISAWAVRSSLATARATTETDMFVGQPTIWAGEPRRAAAVT
ncbi:hypothetical protein OM076_11420 [Solirubrobacter ginsenosidimutans]|uniref:Uncharacterized protein n=1 Tax=Solirubrobacter ginsenosidimutans TaxID=490573 RepID=A0A9X3S264_9ACTN|nr:hypothetical protein [Solirubrobacter ginsenosidimutans]MDA0160876.1 hypothetical protein [Solirubrobacter ginsenosidimutans]